MADVRLVDTHCHLDADQFASEPTATLLARAAAEGVTRVVTVGTRLADSRTAVELAAAHEGVWATVGVDPKSLAGFDEPALARVAELAARPKVVAIGEIGLDYHWMRSPPEVQQEAFRAQLALARRLGLPVVIHSREADDDTAAVLLEWAAEVEDASAQVKEGAGAVVKARVSAVATEHAGAVAIEHANRQAEAPFGERPLGVLHCYAGDLDLARKLFAAGFLISLSGIVTFNNARRTHTVAAGLPLEALVLETDAPYLAPHPHRGGRNEPALVRLVAARVAELRGLSLTQVARATSANAARLFRWTDS